MSVIGKAWAGWRNATNRVIAITGIGAAITAGLAVFGLVASKMRQSRRVPDALPEGAAPGMSYMNVPEATLTGGVVKDGPLGSAVLAGRNGGINSLGAGQPNIESPDGRPIGQLGSP